VATGGGVANHFPRPPGTKPGSPVRVVPPAESVSLPDGIARTDVADFLLGEVTGAGHPRAKVTITAA
jgi:hypothetical protein